MLLIFHWCCFDMNYKSNFQNDEWPTQPLLESSPATTHPAPMQCLYIQQRQRQRSQKQILWAPKIALLPDIPNRRGGHAARRHKQAQVQSIRILPRKNMVRIIGGARTVSNKTGHRGLALRRMHGCRQEEF